MAVYLSKELMRWAADMEKKIKGMGNTEEIEGIRSDLKKLEGVLNKMKRTIDRAARAMEALIKGE